MELTIKPIITIKHILSYWVNMALAFIQVNTTIKKGTP